MFKKSHWAQLKQLFQKQGIHLEQPIFHSTSYGSAEKIIKEGFRARAGGQGYDTYYQNAVCFSRNLCFSEKANFGDGEVIFVLDLSKVKNRFNTYSYDWSYNNRDDNNKNPYFKSPASYEYEERVSRSDKNVRDVTEPETVIHPKYIEAIILKKDDTRGVGFWSKHSKAYPIFVRTSKALQRLTNNKSMYKHVQNKEDFLTEGEGLITATRNGDLQTIKNMLASPNDMPQYVLEQALSISVKKKHVDIVRFLLTKGTGFTKTKLTEVLNDAVITNNKDLVSLLLYHGAHADTPSLSTAAFFGFVDVLRLLLKAGGDPNFIYEMDPVSNQKIILADAKIYNLLVEYGLRKQDAVYV